jgi:hypothetical protein
VAKQPVTRRTAFALFNAGRADNVSEVKRSFREANRHLKGLGIDVVLFLNEIGESDKGYNDHALVREFFKGWNLNFMDTREPILSLGANVGHDKTYPAAKGLAGQSPARVINDGRFWTPDDSGPPVGVDGGHYPAGAYNGRRPPHIKRELRERYDNMLGVHRKRVEAHKRAGLNWVYGMDVNRRPGTGFPKMLPREVTVLHKGPDIIRAGARDGHRVKIHKRYSVPMHIEKLHPLHVAILSFPKK